MSAPTPTFSVIVVCKNPGPRLQAALASVWEQGGCTLELIIIDGASTDGTREWLETQRPRLAHFVSEPDHGVYEAMNKGLALARGDWVLFLGADDRLVGANVLNEVLSWMKRTEAGVVVGEVAYNDGRIYKLSSNVNPLPRNFVHHQATFYRRTLFAESGDFDTSLMIMGDYELNLRLWKNHVRFKPMKLRVSACGTGGLSDSGRWRGYAEEIRVRHRYAAAWRCWFWDILSVARWLRKKTVRTFKRRR